MPPARRRGVEGVQTPQGRLAWCAHRHTHPPHPTPPHGLTGLPPLCTRTRVGPRGAATGRRRWGGGGQVGGPFPSQKTLQRTKTRRDESRCVPRNTGAGMSNFAGLGRGAQRRAAGAKGSTYYSARRWAPGSALLLRLLLRTGPRGWQPGLPAHMPQRQRG